MTVLVVACRTDPAGRNIAKQLISGKGLKVTTRLGEVEAYERDEVLLVHVNEECIYADNVDKLVQADAIIFASKHRSEAGEKSLTVHTTGNPTSSALYGGLPRSLSTVDPQRMRAALLELDAAAHELGYQGEITFEATHHGPTELKPPVMFVEVGSSEQDWRDEKSAAVVAEAIWKAATEPSDGRLAVGFGGGHYPRKFADNVRNDGFAVGHILSKYFFEEFDAQIVEQALRRTAGNCSAALIDWKGMKGSDRQKLLTVLNEIEVEVIRV